MDEHAVDPQLSSYTNASYQQTGDIPVGEPSSLGPVGVPDLQVDPQVSNSYQPTSTVPAPFAVAPSAAAKAAAATLSGYSQYQVQPPVQHSDGIPVNDLPTSYQAQEGQSHAGQAEPPIDPAFEVLAAVVAASANADHSANGAALPASNGDESAQANQQTAPRPRKSRPRNLDDDDDDDASVVEALGSDALPPRSPRPVRAASSRWTPEEDAQLIELVSQEPALTWNAIGDKLGKRGQLCGQRWYNFLAEFNKETVRVEPNGKIPKGMVYRDAGSSSDDDFDPEPEVDDGTAPAERKPTRILRRWAGEDDEKLKEGYEQFGWDWDKIAEHVGHGRTGRACKERWTKTLKPHDPDDEAAQDLDEPISEDGDYEIESDIDAEEDADWDEDVKPSPAPRAKVPRQKKIGGVSKSNFTPAGQSPVFLPKEALVANPPIPFTPQSVIRGRRTLDAQELKGKLVSQTGKQKKVHECPAENCTAAFKRSEHLKRHYRSVHMGSKPFPCKMPDCNKSFSRKDNLQQHMAMVHSMRAIKIEDADPQGETHRYEPINENDPDAPKKRQPRKSTGGPRRSTGGASATASQSPAPMSGNALADGNVAADAASTTDNLGGSIQVQGQDQSQSGQQQHDTPVDPNIIDSSVVVDPALADATGGVGGSSSNLLTDNEPYQPESAFLSQLKAFEAQEAASQQQQQLGNKRGREDEANPLHDGGAKRARSGNASGDIAVGDIAVDVEPDVGDGSYERTRV